MRGKALVPDDRIRPQAGARWATVFGDRAEASDAAVLAAGGSPSKRPAQSKHKSARTSGRLSLRTSEEKTRVDRRARPPTLLLLDELRQRPSSRRRAAAASRGEAAAG
jgi:hypothetical protein